MSVETPRHTLAVESSPSGRSLTGATHSDVLKLKIRIAEPRLIEALVRFEGHPKLVTLLPEYLFKLHCSVTASVPLLESALQRARERADDCPVAAALVPYFAKHIREECNHDKWLLEDIEVLGVSREDTLARLPPAEVAAMIGAQYYWINHAHPVALLAYLAVVEGTPMSSEFLDRIVERTSIPRKALRSFYLHAELDVRHSAELWQCIDSLPLQPWHTALLGVSAMLVLDQLAQVADSVVKSG